MRFRADRFILPVPMIQVVRPTAERMSADGGIRRIYFNSLAFSLKELLVVVVVIAVLLATGIEVSRRALLEREKGEKLLEKELQTQNARVRGMEQQLAELGPQTELSDERREKMSQSLQTQKRVRDSVYIRLLQERVDSQAVPK
jgi:hypothetical protein